MKKFPLLLAAVAMIAVGSAFAAPREADPSDVYVQTSPGVYELESTADGECISLANSHCTFLKNDQGQYIATDNNRAWQPN